MRSTTAATRSFAWSRMRAPAESTTYTHWQPASTWMAACSASFSGETRWLSMRNPTVSRPRSRAAPKCWYEVSASVQCVATRTTVMPASLARLRSSTVPTPGSSRAAIFARLASSAAAAMSFSSSVPEKP